MSLMGATAMAPLLAATGASGADVNITANVTSGVNLNSQAGSTAEVWPGVTVTNAAASSAVTATISAWALTNRGSISSSFANTIALSFAGSSVTNFGTISAGSTSNAIFMTGGGGVDNKAGATITSALSSIIIGTTSAGAGSVINAGTITQSGTTGDLVQLRFGGTVTNLQGGTITANNNSNAVSVGQGAARAVINSGVIANTGTGNASGVLMQGGASTLTNTVTGRIGGTFNGIYTSASAPLTFTNDGLIESTAATGAARAVEATGGGTFINTGIIRSIASDGLYLARAGTVTNTGTISGAVNAINFSGNYARTLNLNTGSVLNGYVQGGTGTDVLVLLGAGSENISKFLAFETLSMQGASWQLSGAGTFSSSTTLQSGVLTVSGTLTSPITTVQTNGTLAGTGTILSTVSNAGTLIGVQGQTLTMNSLSLAATSQINATFGAPGTQALFNVTGPLVLDGALNISAITGFGQGVYRIFSYGGALTNNGLDIGSVPTGTAAASYSVQTAVSGQVNLVSTAVIPVGPYNFWDGAAAGSANNSVIDGGSGIWSATAANWTNVNGTLNTAMTPQPGFAVFQSAPGTVTVDGSAGPIGVTGMQFAASGYVLTGAPITLTGVGGNSSMRVGDGTVTGTTYTATIASELTGNSRLVKDDLGTLILTGANSYTGGTTIAAGMLQIGNGVTTGSIVGDVMNNAILAFNRSNDLTFTGIVGGSGKIRQIGSGKTELTGDSSPFTGTTTVENGTLAVNGQLGGTLDVFAGGRLQGVGTVGNAIVSGVIAPGNSIGTLNVGNITFNAGSIYEVDVNATGQTDLIRASGTATITGGTVRVLAGMGNYAPATTYKILTAQGSLTANSAFSGVTSNLAFLAPSLSYDANNVWLTMTRNTVTFNNVGITPNQIAAGGGVEGLGLGNPVYNAVLNLSAPQTRYAFDQLSGEVHASARTVVIEDSRFLRGAVNDRLRAAFGGVGAAAMPVMAYAEGGPQYVPATTDRFAVWGQAFGSWGHWNSDGNAARLNRSTGGFFVGGDAPVFDTWRFGAVAGYSRTNFNVRDRASSGSSDNYHLGLYGGTSWGDLAFRTGAAYTWHDITTNRSVVFPGFGDSLKGKYDAGTAQVFGELAYGMNMGAARFEPFANLAYVNVHTDGFRETGGAAALTSPSANTDATFTTLGVRASATFNIGKTILTAKGGLGWRRAFGDMTPLSIMHFAGGGTAFTIAGVPIVRDAAVIEAGLDQTITPNATLGVSYNGQSGSGLSDQSVKAIFNIRL